MLKKLIGHFFESDVPPDAADFLMNSHSSEQPMKRPKPRTHSLLNYQALEARQLLAGDAVVNWNEVTLDVIRATPTPPPVASRAMAIVHTAIYDAVNSICNENQIYHSRVPAHPKANLEAAVAGAAERTLKALFPTQTAVIQSALDSALAAIPDNLREIQGLEVGRAVADLILASRASDGWDATSSYVPGSDPGDWRPTAPAFANPLLPHWGGVTTFGVVDGTQFGPEPTPALISAEYAAALHEVKYLGSATSSTRTADQTDIAKIWAGGPGTATPPGQWNMIAQDISGSKGFTLQQSARMFAMLNMAMADAAITCWEAKYHFDFWRPISAIQLADTDGNSATTADATWAPLLTTPPFPAYTSGHSTFSGSGSTVLAKLLGTHDVTFTLKSEVPAVADRTYTSLWDAAEEAGMSRIYGGIHFQFDNSEGLRSGRAIGEYVFNRYLKIQDAAVAVFSENNLYVYGTVGNDNLTICRQGSDVVVRNYGSVVSTVPAGPVQKVVASGSNGNDRLFVGLNVNASSELYGGSGNDQLYGGKYRDFLFGEAGNDWLFGRDGNDYLDGGAGFNHLFGGNGDDELWGRRNRDRLFGGSGSDNLRWL
jgi:hypothetical protein